MKHAGVGRAESGSARGAGPGSPGTGRGARLLRLGAGILALLVLAAVFGGRFVRERRAEERARPPRSGVVRVAGLAADVRVRRDESGVPHIEAGSEADAWFGLGFIHAQDRLAQMLWLRRLANGRSAEWAGSEGVPWDRLARSFDFAGLAEARLAGLDEGTRALLDRYADGVEARLDRIRSGAVPAPIALRGALRGPTPTIEAWRPADSLASWFLVAFQSGTPLAGPLVLDDLVQRLGGGGARIFAPSAQRDGGLGAASALPLEAPGAQPERVLVDAGLGRSASVFATKALVVSGAHTASGAPLVAASYVLAPRVPSLFHQSHVRGGTLDVAGVTVPGLPLFLAGRNTRVAWALSFAPVVGLDLYRETIRGSGDAARYNDGLRWLDVDARRTKIRVRGAADEWLDLRSTRHGPLIQPLLSEPREALAAAWVGTRGERAVAPLLALPGAEGAEAIGERLDAYDGVPLRVVYADADGAAHQRLVGWIPERRLPTGLSPVPGRTRHFDWRNPIGREALPHRTVSQERPYLVLADGSPVGAEPRTVEWLWQRGDERRRMERLLGQMIARGGVGLRDVAVLHHDRAVPGARRFIAAAVDVAGEGARDRATAAEVIDLLNEWDGVADGTSRGAVVYHVFVDELVEQLFAAPVGRALLRRYRALPHTRIEAVARDLVIRSAKRRVAGGWLDRERAQASVREALRRSWAALGHRLGPNRSHWRWKRLHRLRFEPFVSAGKMQGPDGVRERGIGGSGETLQAAGFTGGGSFEVDRASTFSIGIDLGAPDQLTTLLAPGQTEHPSDPLYANGVDAWREGRPSLILTTRLLVDAGAGEWLRLEPEN